MAYDSAVVSFTVKTNKVDLVDAAHINAVQSELVTIETRLGVLVSGDRASLAARLSNMMDADGSLLSGTSYPSPALATQLFYRTDLDTMYIRNAANSGWNQVSGITNIQIFTSSGTFTAPAGITKVYVDIVGGGGGGGGCSNAGNAGGGGGGGACMLLRPFTVTPGNNYTVTIAAAAAGGATQNDAGSSGGTCSFDTLSATGGTGGQGSAGGSGVGGAGGTSTLNASTTTGGGAGAVFAGGTGGTRSSGTSGGGGGTILGKGPDGVASGDGTAGTANTGGGGAGGGGGGAGNKAGGAGGTGIVIVRW